MKHFIHQVSAASRAARAAGVLALAASLVQMGDAHAQQAPDGPMITVADAAGTSRMASSSALMAKAREQGAIRVIVGMDTGIEVDGALTTAQELAQRTTIDAMQAQIMNVVRAPESVRQFESIPYMAMTVSPADLSRIMAAPGVTSIEEDVPVPPTLADSVPLVDAPRLWRRGHQGNGAAVAILDTGVRPNHAAFRDPSGRKVIKSACFSTNSSISTSLCPNGRERQVSNRNGRAGRHCDSSVNGCDHGTHVAAIAAGFQGGNHGVARRADIISIQVFSRFDSTAYCGDPDRTPCVLSYISDQIAGLERVLRWRKNGVDIAAANMSLGGGEYTDFCDEEQAARKAIIDRLLANGVATVISSGNNSFDGSVGAPACISSAITVGSTTKFDGMSFFSNHDEIVDILAPGSGIVAADADGNRRGLTTKSGTSMAAPHVAGAFALLQGARPNATPHEIERALECSGHQISRDMLPKPRISMLKAFRALKRPDDKQIFRFRNNRQVRQWDDISGRWQHRRNKMRVVARDSATWYISQAPFCANDAVVVARMKRQDPDTEQNWASGILLSSTNDENGYYSGLEFLYYVGHDGETVAAIWEKHKGETATSAGDATLLCQSDSFDGKPLGATRKLKVKKRKNNLVFWIDNREVCRTKTDDKFENGHVAVVMAAPENDRSHRLDVKFVRTRALRQSKQSFASIDDDPAIEATLSAPSSNSGTAGDGQSAFLKAKPER